VGVAVGSEVLGIVEGGEVGATLVSGKPTT
jgi:hypothetical protein